MGAETLADGELRELVSSVVDTSVPEPMGAYLFGPGDAGAEIGRHVEREVFLEAFGNTPELLAEEYSRYDPTSIFFCVVDHRRRLPVGTMRLIVPYPGGPGLKSLNDVEPVWDEPAKDLLAMSGVDIPTDATWDIATLAVMPEYRGAAATGLASLALYQSVMGMTQRLGIGWIVAIVDVVVHRMVRLKFRDPFVAYAPGRSYLGSPSSLPVYVDLVDWKRRLEVIDPTIHDIIFDAVGIAPAVRPLDFDAGLHTVPRAELAVPGVVEIGRQIASRWRDPVRADAALRHATALPPDGSAAAAAG